MTTCSFCGKEFSPRQWNQKFCNKTCNDAYYTRERRIIMKQYYDKDKDLITIILTAIQKSELDCSLWSENSQEQLAKEIAKALE